MANELTVPLADYGKEEWRELPGYPGYMVSSLARVKSVDRVVAYKNGRTRFCWGKIKAMYIARDGYYRVGINHSKHVMLHRLIALAFLGMRKEQRVDHRDRNKTNNAINNLRISDESENMWNTPKKSGPSKSKYKGICYLRKFCIYRARITVRGKGYCLGNFKTETEAAFAYDLAAEKHYGEFALTNFKLGLLNKKQSETNEAQLVIDLPT